MTVRDGWRWRRAATRWSDSGAAVYYPHRARLLAGLSGTVLEIGPGGGASVRHLPRRVRWIGLEPNRYLHERLRRTVGNRGQVLLGEAERIPLADASVDAVVGMIVLCSVHDQERAVAEIARVLRPGGRYVFLEHVLAAPGTWSRFMLRVSAPMSRWLDGGCDPARETGRLIEATFDHVEFDEFPVGFPLGVTIPHLAGWATSSSR
jgi:SAM-dependent methyltransferase